MYVTLACILHWMGLFEDYSIPQTAYIQPKVFQKQSTSDASRFESALRVRGHHLYVLHTRVSAEASASPVYVTLV